MELSENGPSWVWHPNWMDRKRAQLDDLSISESLWPSTTSPGTRYDELTADTRYELSTNSQLVHVGRVKGDEDRWLYDQVYMQPYLRLGDNLVTVHVLRFFHANTYASALYHMSIGGLCVRTVDRTSQVLLDNDASWKTTIDPSAELRVGEAYDIFLHTFERVDNLEDAKLVWAPTKAIVIEELLCASLSQALTQGHPDESLAESDARGPL